MSIAAKGRKMSDEFRKKVSDGHKGQISWNKGMKGQGAGRKMSKESIEKGAAKRRGRKASIETKIKQSIAHIGKPNTYSRKPIYQYNLEGELLCKYESCSKASELTGISMSNISYRALHPERKPNKYIWRYEINTNI